MQDRQYTISPKSLEGVETDITAILKVFSVIIFIGGFIGGIVLGKQLAGVHNLFVTRYSDEVDFSWGIALLIWLSALLEGSLLLALREVLIVMHIHQAQDYTVTLPAAEAPAMESTSATPQPQPQQQPQHPSEPKPAVQPEATPREGYILCPVCGMEQPAKRELCWKCGARFSKPVQPRTASRNGYVVCPACGAEQPAGNEQCWQCDAPFSK